MNCKCNGKHVKILFIRHGFSCANSLQKYSPISGSLKRLLYTDPPLTLRGVKDIIQVRKHIPKDFQNPDAVFSSVLIRAIQTAHFLFPNKIVNVAPFIKELGVTAGNQALSLNDQKQAIIDQNKLLKDKGIDVGNFKISYSLVTNHGPVKLNWKQAHEISYDKFIFWLEAVLPYVLHHQKVDTSNPQINVVVVGHSNFMKKYIKSR